MRYIVLGGSDENHVNQMQHIKRKGLRRHEGQRVACKATVDQHSTADYAYGVNAEKKRRMLLKGVTAGSVSCDHVWVQDHVLIYLARADSA